MFFNKSHNIQYSPKVILFYQLDSTIGQLMLLNGFTMSASILMLLIIDRSRKKIETKLEKLFDKALSYNITAKKLKSRFMINPFKQVSSN